MSHSPSSTQLPPSGRLHRLRGGLALLALTLSLSLATNAFGIVARTAVDIQSCATEYIQLGDEALTWGELKARDKAQTSQAFESPAAAKQAFLEAKSASRPIDTGASSYENKRNFSTLSSVKPAQRYEKVTDIASSFKEQTLLYISLDNGQTIQATAGHPFKTREGWRDAVLLKKGGQLLLGGEADAAERYATILEIREEVKTTAVFNLEVANLHTFFVGVDGVVVHNGWTPPTTEKHHTIPKEILRDLPPSVAKHPTVRGCKGSPNLKPIPYAKHREIHQGPGGGAYNEKFKDAIEAAGGNREMTPATVTNIRDNLVKLFGL